MWRVRGLAFASNIPSQRRRRNEKKMETQKGRHSGGTRREQRERPPIFFSLSSFPARKVPLQPRLEKHACCIDLRRRRRAMPLPDERHFAREHRVYDWQRFG